jgi:hypothetical protein
VRIVSYYATFGWPGEPVHPMAAVHMSAQPPGIPIMFYGLNQLLEGIPDVADSLGMPLRHFICEHDQLRSFSLIYSNAELAETWS